MLMNSLHLATSEWFYVSKYECLHQESNDYFGDLCVGKLMSLMFAKSALIEGFWNYSHFVCGSLNIFSEQNW